MSINIYFLLQLSSYDLHYCDCTCVNCYSLGLLSNLVKHCKCKLPLYSYVCLHFIVRSRRVECKCLGGNKILPTIFFCNCGSSSQEVVQLVDENAGIINSWKTQYAKHALTQDQLLDVCRKNRLEY